MNTSSNKPISKYLELDDFIKHVGGHMAHLTDKQLLTVKTTLEEFTDVLFSIWRAGLHKNADN